MPWGILEQLSLLTFTTAVIPAVLHFSVIHATSHNYFGFGPLHISIRILQNNFLPKFCPCLELPMSLNHLFWLVRQGISWYFLHQSLVTNEWGDCRLKDSVIPCIIARPFLYILGFAICIYLTNNPVYSILINVHNGLIFTSDFVCISNLSYFFSLATSYHHLHFKLISIATAYQPLGYILVFSLGCRNCYSLCDLVACHDIHSL